MAMIRVKLEGYTIHRTGGPGSYVFLVLREIGEQSWTVKEFEYFIDAAKYIAEQKGIDNDFRVGYVEALIQVYWNN